jgi:hypothetical protein
MRTIPLFLISLWLLFTLFASPCLVIGISQNSVYIVPQASNAELYNTTMGEIWIDAVNFQSGQINLTYDPTVVNITNWERNSSNFPLGGWDSSTNGKEWITLLASSSLTGDYHVGTFTIHCIGEEASTILLDFTAPSALFDPNGTEIEAAWIDGTLTCASPLLPSPTPSPTQTPSSIPAGGGGAGEARKSPELTPLSTASPTPQPALSPSSGPSSSPPSVTPTASLSPPASSSPKPERTPGFELFLAICGLLAVARYLKKN